jgi:hypothetical protein
MNQNTVFTKKMVVSEENLPHAPIVQIDRASVRLLGRRRVHGRLILKRGGDAFEAVIVAVQHQRDLRAREGESRRRRRVDKEENET